MGIAGKVAFGLLIVAWLLVIIALITDDYLSWTENDEDTYAIWGATVYRFKITFFGTTFEDELEYSDLCDGDTGDDDTLTDDSETENDYCDLAGRGVVLIICQVISLITGLLCILGGLYYEFNCLPLAPLFLKKLVGIGNAAASCIFCLLGCLVWWMGNPILEDAKDYGFDDELVLGASWYLTFFAALIYGGCIFVFAKVFDGPVPST